MRVFRTEPGRFWSWLLVVIGSGLLVAVNVGHAHVRAQTDGVGLSWLAVGWGLSMPLMAVAAVQAARAVPSGRRRLAVFLSWAAVSLVIVTACYTSWLDTVAFLSSMGYGQPVALLTLASAAGMLFLGVSGLSATRSSRTGRATMPPPPGGSFNGTGPRSYSATSLR